MSRKFNNKWVQGMLHGGREYTRWSDDGVNWDAWVQTPALNAANAWTSSGNTFNGFTSSGSIFLDAGANYNSLSLKRSGMEGRLEASPTSINLATFSAHPLTFRINSSEKGRIEEVNGDLLWGTTATIDPSTGTTTGFCVRGTGRVWRRSDGYNPFIQARLTTDGVVQEFYRQNTNVGNIQVTSTGTTYSTSSDHRRKYDIQSIVTFSLTPEQFDVLSNAELRIMALRPVFHRWNDAPEKGVVTGFIAHEAQQVVPHAVTGKKDEIVDVGREIFPAHEVEREIIDEDGNTLTVTVTVPEVVNEGVRRDALAEGALFEKTGEEPVFQTMDYGLITADIVAALQCVIHTNMLQGEEIEALKVANADMASRLAAIEQHLALA